MIKRITNSPAETLHLGQKLANYLRGGDILAISGELGAGKTVLIKGLAAGLGIKQNVRSPSFNLMKVYQINRTPKHLNTKTIKQLIHLDCYRLKRPAEAVEIGLFDYLGQPRTVMAIEWAEKIANLLKGRRVKKIKIQVRGKEKRKIIIV